MPEPIAVVDYQVCWADVFETLRTSVAACLGSVAVRIEHVGSTSVPGLAAKPIIDMDVVVASTADLPLAIERLGALGYVHQGDLGIPGREAFQTPPDHPPHHLYVCTADCEELHRHLLFRDYLRTHSENAKAYSELKKDLAVRFRNDRNAYSEAKTEFVREILKRASG